MSLLNSERRPVVGSGLETLRLDHLQMLTDDTGLFQHSVGSLPDPHTGYTTDDNVRAFLAMARLWSALPERRSEIEPLLRRYVTFLLWAQRRHYNAEESCGGSGEGVHGDGWFRNFCSYDRRFLEPRGSVDCQGRCLWALAEADSRVLPHGVRMAVRQMLECARHVAPTLTAPHAVCYVLIGASHRATDGPYREILAQGVARLITLYEEYSASGWQWFEPQMTYDNARFPEALLRAGIALGDHRAIGIARITYDFLADNSLDASEGYLMPIGCHGWWRPGQEKAVFDQQTIEAGAYVESYRYAAQAFGDERYALISQRAREWFHGNNIHRLPLYDPDTGGCYDGLTAHGLNLNQGAESTLSYLLAESSLLL